MSFERAWGAYQHFTNRKIYDPPIVINKAAQQSLAKILFRELPEFSSLKAGETGTFKFTEAPWQEWEAKYHTEYSVGRHPSTDGLMAAMAGFSLRALADGTVKAEGGGKFTITVTKIAVYAMDRFNFPTGDKFLGFWSCSKGTVSLWNGHKGAVIHDPDFQAFRNKFSHGSDFLTLSNLHTVVNYSEFSYVYP